MEFAGAGVDRADGFEGDGFVIADRGVGIVLLTVDALPGADQAGQGAQLGFPVPAVVRFVHGWSPFYPYGNDDPEIMVAGSPLCQE